IGEVRAHKEVPGNPFGIHDWTSQVLATVPDHDQIGSWRGHEARPWPDGKHSVLDHTLQVPASSRARLFGSTMIHALRLRGVLQTERACCPHPSSFEGDLTFRPLRYHSTQTSSRSSPTPRAPKMTSGIRPET